MSELIIVVLSVALISVSALCALLGWMLCQYHRADCEERRILLEDLMHFTNAGRSKAGIELESQRLEVEKSRHESARTNAPPRRQNIDFPMSQSSRSNTIQHEQEV